MERPRTTSIFSMSSFLVLVVLVLSEKVRSSFQLERFQNEFGLCSCKGTTGNGTVPERPRAVLRRPDEIDKLTPSSWTEIEFSDFFGGFYSREYRRFETFEIIFALFRDSINRVFQCQDTVAIEIATESEENMMIEVITVAKDQDHSINNEALEAAVTVG